MKLYENSQDIVAAPPAVALNTFNIKPITSNTTDVKPHSIKIELSLAYKSEKNIKFNNELIQKKNKIRNNIIAILEEKKYKELQGIQGRITLSEEIKEKINVFLETGKIKEVYFTELVLN